MPPEMSGWRFLLDENIDPKTATYLEKEGGGFGVVFLPVPFSVGLQYGRWHAQ